MPLLQVLVLCAVISTCVAPPPGGGGGGPPFGGPQGGGAGGGRGGVPPGKGAGNGPPNPGKGNPFRGDRPQLDDDALKTLRDNWKKCQGGDKRCNDHSQRQQRNRDAVRRSLQAVGGGGQWKGLDNDSIDRRFKKAFEVKKALYAIHGLSEFQPHDNGLIGGDMMFNEQQLDRMLSRTKGTVDSAASGDVPLIDAESVAYNPLTGTADRQKRADTLALDYYGGNKWPSTTINFYIGSSTFTSSQAQIIRAALQSIQSSSCLKFVEGWKYPVMEFVKTPDGTDEGTCGWSDVGYQGNRNQININFASSVCKSTLQGVVIHETLHSLGFVHEHTRYDRDRYLKIDWTNVDPGSTDVFTKDDPHDHNPYCVPFDPLSIMHYDPYVGALDPSKPVMTPVSSASFYLPRMGQGTKMAASDITLLNKMYCRASTCKDKSTNCGWTACGDCSIYGSVCPKSCNKC